MVGPAWAAIALLAAATAGFFYLGKKVDRIIAGLDSNQWAGRAQRTKDSAPRTTELGEGRIDVLGRRVDVLGDRLDSLDRRLTARIDGLGTRLDTLIARVDEHARRNAE